jgi:hypothetical protein
MAYGEPQLQDWDVQYRVQVVHPNGGYIQITAADQGNDPAYQPKLDEAVQAALDLLVANGYTLDQGLKSCAAARTITVTPVE